MCCAIHTITSKTKKKKESEVTYRIGYTKVIYKILINSYKTITLLKVGKRNESSIWINSYDTFDFRLLHWFNIEFDIWWTLIRPKLLWESRLWHRGQNDSLKWLLNWQCLIPLIVGLRMVSPLDYLRLLKSTSLFEWNWKLNCLS